MGVLELLERHPGAWRGVSRHHLLDAVREDTLATGAFETWLAQDHLFVADLLVFQSRLLARAPRSDRAVLAGGLVAVEAELGWFEEKAGECGIKLEAPRHSMTAAYRGFLLALEHESYAAGITALWALERAYLEAWRSATPGHPDYREFVEHWTRPEFADYVVGLEKDANSALDSGGEVERAEAAFSEVAQLERDF
ncbi:MAG: TenA family transcriptional regulator [Actinomycetota bacterium]|nr:TenA family transcriptional regulator [Actinomycetota bacterium]